MISLLVCHFALHDDDNDEPNQQYFSHIEHDRLSHWSLYAGLVLPALSIHVS